QGLRQAHQLLPHVLVDLVAGDVLGDRKPLDGLAVPVVPTRSTIPVTVIAPETTAGATAPVVVAPVAAATVVVVTTGATRPVITPLEPTRRTPTTLIVPTRTTIPVTVTVITTEPTAT
ncbi:hypothetical protein PUR30_01130, partial [Streptomyces sp. JV190]|nr:hypothetical protein [Streptomyces sp. JV190]